MSVYCPFCTEEVPPLAKQCPGCGTVYDSYTIDYMTARGKEELPWQPKQRRRNIRVSLTLKVSYFSLQDFVNSYLFDLSTGGLFLKANEPLNPGVKLRLKIFLPDQEEPMEVLGQVMWVRKEEEVRDQAKQPPGMGIKFLNPSADNLKRIINILSQSLG